MKSSYITVLEFVHNSICKSISAAMINSRGEMGHLHLIPLLNGNLGPVTSGNRLYCYYPYRVV